MNMVFPNAYLKWYTYTLLYEVLSFLLGIKPNENVNEAHGVNFFLLIDYFSVSWILASSFFTTILALQALSSTVFLGEIHISAEGSSWGGSAWGEISLRINVWKSFHILLIYIGSGSCHLFKSDFNCILSFCFFFCNFPKSLKLKYWTPCVQRTKK